MLEKDKLMKLNFIKMEGLGNDYVYIDSVKEDFKYPYKSDLATCLSDRHFGVGSDGLIFVNKSDIADFEMEMYNADGSRSEMCGNGIRCVAKLVYDKGYTDKKDFTIESMGSIKKIKIVEEKDKKASLIRVDMGEPILKPSLIPVSLDQPMEIAKGICVSTNKLDAKVTCVSMGNPHAVIFTDLMSRSWADLNDLPIETIGPEFENHKLFPNRVNAEFVKILDDENVEMRVWERGTGETLACGTGCCATVVACVLNERTKREVNVHLKGGVLKIFWNEEDNHVYMTGPARTVFTGTFETKI